MIFKMLSLVMCLSALTLSSCCCVDDGIDPPQPNQFEAVTPPMASP